MKQNILSNNSRFFQYLATFAGSFSVISSGINLGWTSPYLPQLLSGNIPGITINDEEGYWCAVMPLVGAPVGALAAALLVDTIGRKSTILCMAPITFFSTLVIGFADSMLLICIARFINGSIEGGLYTALPMYLGEISDPAIRGFLTSTISIAAVIGMLLINIIGPLFSIFDSSLICAAVPALHFLMFLGMPESPYYCIKKNRLEDARRSLQILRGTPNIEEEMTSLCEAVYRQEKGEKGRLIDIVAVKINRKAALVYLIVCIGNKFSGKNPLTFYTTTIFEAAGGNIDPYTSVIIYSTVEVLANISALFLIDRFGRRPLMIFSALGCATAVGFEGLYFYLKETNSASVEDFGWFPITSLVAYNIVFNLGLAYGPVLLLGELFPTNIKAKALGIADTISVIMGTAASKIFQFTKDSHSMYLPFWIFSACTFVALLSMIKFMPETKGKTLEEIQLYVLGNEKDDKFTVSRDKSKDLTVKI